MNAIAASVYVASVLALWVKFVFATTIQARERFRTRHFRYDEDAHCWQGVVGEDSPRCLRAQSLIRNDGESQPYYLALGAVAVALDAWSAALPYYFGIYTLSRFAHAYFLFTGRQPHRTRVFGLGLLVVSILAAHVLVAVIGRLP